jgi:hypothetical protein
LSLRRSRSRLVDVVKWSALARNWHAKSELPRGWPSNRVPCGISEFFPRVARAEQRRCASCREMLWLKMGDVEVSDVSIFVLL